MESPEKKSDRIYFILGCTACGKAAVGRELARKLGGQIISVDSMKIYRRMDIGTATPSKEVQAEIKHHCLDIVEPSQAFSVADYVRHAEAAAEKIRTEGAIPLAVGGTSLYIKAMAEGLFEGPAGDPELRAELARRQKEQGLESLHAELTSVDPVSAERIHPNDEKRIMRALEVFYKSGQPISQLQQQWDQQDGAKENCVLIGLRREKEDLHGRINRRVKKMVHMGLRDEVESLLAEPAGLAQPGCPGCRIRRTNRIFSGARKIFRKGHRAGEDQYAQAGEEAADVASSVDPGKVV